MKGYFETLDELKEFLCDFGYEDTIVLENEDYLPAVIGTDSDGRLIYSYDKMAEFLMERDKMSYEEACEWIDYNTIRALPYMGPMHPIIIREFSSMFGELDDLNIEQKKPLE